MRDGKPYTFLGIRVSAILETFIFLSALTLLDYIFGDGTRFLGRSPHPFWIIILLVTVQYGTPEGIFATLLSTVFLYSGNMPAQKADESLFEYQYDLAFLPALWFITAFILGEIRMRIGRENQKLKEEVVQARSEAETITAAYDVVKEANSNLGVHLAGQEKTAAATYKTFKVLGSQDPAEVIFGIDVIVKTALNPEKFSVFAMGPNGLEAATCHGWDSKDSFSRRFKKDNPLFEEIAKKKRMVCVVNKMDHKILGQEGIAASPLIDNETGEVFGMLKIEKMNFLDLNLSRLETFRIISELIGAAYANAKRYKMLQQNSIYSPQKGLLSYSFFKNQCAYLNQLQDSQSLKASIVSLSDISRGFDEKLVDGLKKILPNNSLLFDGKKNGREVYALVLDLNKGQESELCLKIKELLEKLQIPADSCKIKVESLETQRAEG